METAGSEKAVVLPPRLFAPPAYYGVMAAGKPTVIDISTPYDKRCKAVHRYDIIDARGLLQLTVPLGKPHGCDHRPTWLDAPVSTHDEWWRRHRIALESAYGRTPYFEFLIDKFDSVLRSPEEWSSWPDAIDLIREANRVVCSILLIDTLPRYERVSGRVSAPDFSKSAGRPYWQVRQHIFGFNGGLSVLDLIFNLGPEAALYLRGQL